LVIIAPTSIKKIWVLSFELEGYVSLGGLGRAVARHVSGLVRRGFDVTVFLPSHGRHLSKDYVERLGMRPVQGFTPCGYRVGVDGVSRRYCLGAEEIWMGGARVIIFKGLDYETGRFIDRWGVYEELPEKACLYTRALIHWIYWFGEKPDMIHANDWPTALAGVAAKNIFELMGYSIPLLYMVHLISSPSFPWHYPSDQWCGLPDTLHRVWNGYSHVKRSTREVWDSLGGNVDMFSLVEADAIASVSWGYMEEILDRFGRWMHPKACVVHNSTDWEVGSVSRYAKERFGTSSRKLLRKRIGDIVGSISNPKTGYLSQKEIIISSSGRATWQKGFDVLIRAADYLDDRFGIIIMAVGVGDKGFEETISKMALERWGKVLILWDEIDGNIRKTITYLSNVYAVPSRYEPFGIVSIEAQALGTPVVVSRTGGLPETMQEIRREGSGTGLLVNPEDPVGLARAIRSLAWASEVADTGDLGLVANIEIPEVAEAVLKKPDLTRVNTIALVDTRFREESILGELVACYEKARQMAYYRAVTP
jgi:starch synthase